MFGLLKNLLIVVFLIGALYAVTLFSSDVKKQADTQFAKVLGAKSMRLKSDNPLPEELKKDAEEQLGDAKEKAMHVDLSDIFRTVNRLQKIPKDMQQLTTDVKNGIESVIKK